MKTVKIQVRGGVADVVQIDKDVKVIIIDHDNKQAHSETGINGLVVDVQPEKYPA